MHSDAYRDDMLKAIEEHQVVIIVAETGAGAVFRCKTGMAACAWALAWV